MAEQEISKIIAVNCGSVNTTAVLIEQEAGAYQLQAISQLPSTHGKPWHDVTQGIQQALESLQQQSGQTLLSDEGQPITPQNVHQHGVDALIILSSAAMPLSVALVALMQDISLESARRAATTTYSSIPVTLTLDDETENHKPKPMEAHLAAIQAALPEVILLVGGVDGGAKRPVRDMASLVLMALNILPEGNKPVVLYAGNREMRAEVAQILGGSVIAVDNVRPRLEIEDFAATQVELERLYIQRKMSRLPGVQTISQWTEYPVIPVSKSFGRLITYLGRHNDLNVMGVDIGSGSTMVATESKAHHGLTIRSDAGVGHSLGNLIKMVPLESFQRWLPFDIHLYDLQNALLNKSLYPSIVPTTHEELLIEYAIAREALRFVVAQARKGWRLTDDLDPQWNLIVGAGSTLTAVPSLAYAALLMLDAIEPWGVSSLALDRNSLAVMLGAIAAVEPLAAVQLAAGASFLNLGTVIAPAGHGQRGKTAVKLKIEYADNQETEEFEVPYGSIKVVPLLTGEQATVEIRPTYYFDMVPGQPGTGASAEVNGGPLGLIIDARGRPLRLPEDDATRFKLLTQWMQQLGLFADEEE